MASMKHGAALAIAACLAACAGVNFVKPKDDELVLGATTKGEIIALMGEPNAKGEQVLNGEQLEIISYAYVQLGAEAAFDWVTPARAITYLFHDDILVGEEFTSSFKSDSTYFDPERAKSIRPGMTEAEVVALLGKPGGEYRYPAIANRNGKCMVYKFVQTKGFTSRRQILTVKLDDKDVVQKAEFIQLGQL